VRPLNRTTVANFTVRFFVERKDAINEANSRTKATDQQHRAVHAKNFGWLIKNAVADIHFDADGVIPGVVVAALEIQE
jgi:hypothetical protein